MSFVRVPINLCYRLMCVCVDIMKTALGRRLSPKFLQNIFLLAQFSLEASLFGEFLFHEYIPV